MKLYHYTQRNNVLNMYKEGIRPNSLWCESIEDCTKFIALFIHRGIIELPYDYAFVSIDFSEDEIVDVSDPFDEYLQTKTYLCSNRIDKKRMPPLNEIPAYIKRNDPVGELLVQNRLQQIHNSLNLKF